MGFFKKTTSSYPARRNRINQQSHPATVIPPPSNYGAQNPTPIAASVYQANGTPVAPTVTVAATTAAASTYTAAAFPSNNAPVQATVYIPGQSPAQPVTSVVPVTATAYVPGNTQTATNTTTHITTPVQPVSAPPATNPLYSNQAPSFNNGNGNYNSDENSFWECSVCKYLLVFDSFLCSWMMLHKNLYSNAPLSYRYISKLAD